MQVLELIRRRKAYLSLYEKVVTKQPLSDDETAQVRTLALIHTSTPKGAGPWCSTHLIKQAPMYMSSAVSSDPRADACLGV